MQYTHHQNRSKYFRFFHSTPTPPQIHSLLAKRWSTTARPPVSLNLTFLPTSSPSFLVLPLLIRLTHIQPQPIRIQVQLILPTCLLQDLRDIPRVFDPPQIHVAPALLDCVSDELGRASFTLRAHDGSLFLLAGFVNDEGGALGFLLGDLLGFDCGGEFGREGEVLVDGLAMQSKA